jgi:hypothetical protein
VTKMTPKELDEFLRARVSARYFEIGDRLAEAVPELAGPLEECIADWGETGVEPGPINITDEVLVPSVERWLQDEKVSSSSLNRALRFIEELASDDDPQIREVAQVVVNSLSGNANLNRVQDRIGPKMHAMLEISRASVSPRGKGSR